MATQASKDAKDLVYFDSGPLVAIGRGPRDPHYVGAARLSEALEESGCEGGTSMLGYMESRHAIAKRAAMSHKCQTGSGAEWDAADSAVRGALARLDETMYDLKRRGLMRIVELERPPDLDSLYADMRWRSGRLLAGMQGRAFRYREVGPCDLIHFAIARHLGALVICTTDAAFADMPCSGSEFGRIQVQLAHDLPSGRLAERA